MFRQQQRFSATSAAIGFNDNSAAARQRCKTAMQRQHLLRHLQHQQFLQHLDQQCCSILQLPVTAPRDRTALCGRGAACSSHIKNLPVVRKILNSDNSTASISAIRRLLLLIRLQQYSSTAEIVARRLWSWPVGWLSLPLSCYEIH